MAILMIAQPEAVFAALGYDTVYFLAEAIRRASSTDGQAIKRAKVPAP